MAHRTLIATTAAAIVPAALMAAPTFAKPSPATPTATAFKIGAFTAYALRDMLNVVPNDGSVLGVGQPVPAISQILADAHAPTDQIALGVDALLVEMPGHVVLLDTGLGPKVGGVLPLSLLDAHVEPGQVTDVLITHSHPDHIGGLVTKEGGLAFPNATIRMSAPEWAFLQSKGGAIATVIATKVRTFAPGAEVIPGIRSVPLPGHTPGHSGYEISSGKTRLLDIGDTAHSAIVSLAKPGWTIAYDTDAAEGRATREAELARLAASHERIFAPHFPFPGVGFVVKAGDGYSWVPKLP
ncbi:MBL fold metallo-hydrolase [Sphingomonas abietis]|uniref:MBL fold metallo-hydrolase n=1 Tax=Sphingomonas abietis TaxID=3012344 RepID=A0ABY7NJC0_9SPHN|nr:MBL fold metallo-hydrolase [Sphingomonas abietis]WBO21423.1 MBL fold metallo-hydrolase [Sphingomonas abietis]